LTDAASAGGRRRGSILLPVIVVLLLIASAATAMTLQARTSLREAAVRRDRLALGLEADAVVRSVALALSEAAATHAEPPFALDGTPQACPLSRGGRVVLAVQDEGGRIDLNKASRDLLLLLLQRAGLSGSSATAATEAIVHRRDPSTAPSPTTRGRTSAPPAQAGYATVDEIDSVPGVTSEVSERLRPALSVASGASGVDLAVASPGLRALIPIKELSGPAFAAFVSPSSHGAFTITGTVVSGAGTRVQRQALLQVDPGSGLGRFMTWEAPVGFDPLDRIPTGPFCLRVREALALR
jgi:general secretion pathway protein K